MNQLQQSERAHRAALQSLASHLADVASGSERLQRESVADLLLEIDGGTAIDDDTLDRIAGRGAHAPRRETIVFVFDDPRDADPETPPGPYLTRAGFEVVNTGGGCMAWRRDNADGSHVLITHDEAGLPDRMGDDVLVGHYPADDYGSPIEPPDSFPTVADGLASLGGDE